MASALPHFKDVFGSRQRGNLQPAEFGAIKVVTVPGAFSHYTRRHFHALAVHIEDEPPGPAVESVRDWRSLIAPDWDDETASYGWHEPGYNTWLN